MSKANNQDRLDIHMLSGKLAFNLECFGDDLAKKKEYKKHLGMDAIHFYLVEKYHWLPAQVKALNFEDLRFLLEEGKSGWTLPADSRDLKPTRYR
jgi:hypothetical protein